MAKNDNQSDERVPLAIGGRNRPGTERQGRKPWTAPRLETITRDAIGAAPNMNPSVHDGSSPYIPV